MSYKSINVIKTVAPKFIEQRLSNTAPPHIKWLLGGIAYLFNVNFERIFKTYESILASAGVITKQNETYLIDTELLKNFLQACFKVQNRVEIKGFIFNIDDANAFIEMLEQES